MHSTAQFISMSICLAFLLPPHFACACVIPLSSLLHILYDPITPLQAILDYVHLSPR